ncbi:MAG: hypothetical protein Q4D38_14100 [Planctomycetia bacterium]|nr:hypothetical protein [Planctomycetia bacterium]
MNCKINPLLRYVLIFFLSIPFFFGGIVVFAEDHPSMETRKQEALSSYDKERFKIQQRIAGVEGILTYSYTSAVNYARLAYGKIPEASRPDPEYKLHEGALNEISIRPDEISGYMFNGKGEGAQGRYRCNVYRDFTVDAEPSETSPQKNKVSLFNVRIIVCTDFISALLESLVRDVPPRSSKVEYQRYYKIDNGPGHACLISPRGDDSISPFCNVVFVRGNVIVRVMAVREMPHPDCDCLDLAFTLDEKLIEMFEKKMGGRPQMKVEKAPAEDIVVTSVNWRELNPFDIERHMKEQKDIYFVVEDWFNYDPRYVSEPSENEKNQYENTQIPQIFGLKTKDNSDDSRLPTATSYQFTIDIPDYTDFPHTFTYSRGHKTSPKTAVGEQKLITVQIAILPDGKQARQKIIEFVKGKYTKDGHLNHLRGRTFNVPLSYKLSMYRIDLGPGEDCIVDVVDGGYRLLEELAGGEPFNYSGSSLACKPYLSDRRLAFVRGNVAVYMFSTDPDVGCMDLALKMDAQLKELMRKTKETDDSKRRHTQELEADKRGESQAPTEEPRTFCELMEKWDKYCDQVRSAFIYRISTNPRRLYTQDTFSTSTEVKELGQSNSPFFCYYLPHENLCVEAMTLRSAEHAKTWMLTYLGWDTRILWCQIDEERLCSEWRGFLRHPGVSRFFLSAKYNGSPIGNFSFEKRFGGFEGHKICEINFMRGNVIVSVYVPATWKESALDRQPLSFFRDSNSQDVPDLREIAWRIDQYLKGDPVGKLSEEEKTKLKTLEIALPETEFLQGKEYPLDFPRKLPDGTVPAEIRLVVSRGEVQQVSENPTLAPEINGKYTVLFGQSGQQTIRCYHLDESGKLLAWGEVEVDVKYAPTAEITTPPASK